MSDSITKQSKRIRKGPIISLWMDGELLGRLDERARRDDLTRSQVVRRSIRAYLAMRSADGTP